LEFDAGRVVHIIKGDTFWVEAVAFSLDGSLLASASRDRPIGQWDFSTNYTVQRPEDHARWVTAVAFSPDGSLLASASMDDTVKLWELSIGRVVQTLKATRA
jgi:WD40 repeat protein